LPNEYVIQGFPARASAYILSIRIPDTCLSLHIKRGDIRAIEIEEYYAAHPVPEREFPELNSLIIGVDIDRELFQYGFQIHACPST